MGTKTTESIIDSFLMLFMKGVGMIVSIKNVKELHKELKQNFVVNKEFPPLGRLEAAVWASDGCCQCHSDHNKHIEIKSDKKDKTLQEPDEESDEAPV